MSYIKEEEIKDYFWEVKINVIKCPKMDEERFNILEFEQNYS